MSFESLLQDAVASGFDKDPAYAALMANFRALIQLNALTSK